MSVCVCVCAGCNNITASWYCQHYSYYLINIMIKIISIMRASVGMHRMAKTPYHSIKKGITVYQRTLIH